MKVIPWDNFYYAFFSIFASIFSILFARSFLETKRYLHKIDIILKVYLLLLTLDLIPILFQNYSYIVDYDLFGVCGLLYLFMSFLRARQGFAPAWFFLIGWSAFIGSLVYVEILTYSPCLKAGDSGFKQY